MDATMMGAGKASRAETVEEGAAREWAEAKMRLQDATERAKQMAEELDSASRMEAEAWSRLLAASGHQFDPMPVPTPGPEVPRAPFRR